MGWRAGGPEQLVTFFCGTHVATVGYLGYHRARLPKNGSRSRPPPRDRTNNKVVLSWRTAPSSAVQLREVRTQRISQRRQAVTRGVILLPAYHHSITRISIEVRYRVAICLTPKTPRSPCNPILSSIGK